MPFDEYSKFKCSFASVESPFMGFSKGIDGMGLEPILNDNEDDIA